MGNIAFYEALQRLAGQDRSPAVRAVASEMLKNFQVRYKSVSKSPYVN